MLWNWIFFFTKKRILCSVRSFVWNHPTARKNKNKSNLKKKLVGRLVKNILMVWTIGPFEQEFMITLSPGTVALKSAPYFDRKCLRKNSRYIGPARPWLNAKIPWFCLYFLCQQKKCSAHIEKEIASGFWDCRVRVHDFLELFY